MEVISKMARRAVRRSLHRMVRPSCHFEACDLSRFSSENEKRIFAADERKRLFGLIRIRGMVNDNAIADELPVVSGLGRSELLAALYLSACSMSDQHKTVAPEDQSLIGRGIIDEIKGEGADRPPCPEAVRRRVSACSESEQEEPDKPVTLQHGA